MLRSTLGGMYLLKADSGTAIARPVPLYDLKGKVQVGKIVETFARIKEPYYLAVLDDGAALVGKNVTSKD